MSLTTIAPIESTIHIANAWLKELREELGWEDRQRVFHALGVVLHALRDRLTVAEAADLGAQLPMLIRGLYYEGWTPKRKPVKERRKQEFLAHIAASFRGHAETYPEEIVWAVLKVLSRHVSAGEIGDVKHVLPAPIRALWPESERTASVTGARS
jgi:uncharacterized protein (DUF2267 family)